MSDPSPETQAELQELENAAELTPAQRSAAWIESATHFPNTPLPNTLPLSDEAISRESIYGDRG